MKRRLIFYLFVIYRQRDRHPTVPRRRLRISFVRFALLFFFPCLENLFHILDVCILLNARILYAQMKSSIVSAREKEKGEEVPTYTHV